MAPWEAVWGGRAAWLLQASWVVGGVAGSGGGVPGQGCLPGRVGMEKASLHLGIPEGIVDALDRGRDLSGFGAVFRVQLCYVLPP